MTNKIYPLMMVLLFMSATLVYAMPSRIQIFDLLYGDNKLSVTDKVTKLGYYPDRKLQPESGFNCTIISDDDETLYSFMFEIPDKIYVDVTDPLKNGLSGGVVERDPVEFALILPYYSEAKGVVFYDEKGNEALSVDVSTEKFWIGKKSSWIWVIFLLLLLAVLAIIIIRNRSKRYTD